MKYVLNIYVHTAMIFPVETPDCSTVDCETVECKPEYVSYVPEGECCNDCKPGM